MRTMEPRATTGTLDELIPVAPFKIPFGSITGVDWPHDGKVTHRRKARYRSCVTNHFGAGSSPLLVHPEITVRCGSIAEL
jgi:hypothetical protein